MVGVVGGAETADYSVREHDYWMDGSRVTGNELVIPAGRRSGSVTIVVEVVDG